jgi:cell division protease FtsH
VSGGDAFKKPFSERTAEVIDEEVRRIVDEAVALAREIVEAERDNIERMADLLLEKETIFSEDIEVVLGKSAQQLVSEELAAEAPVTETDDEAEGGVSVKYDDGTDVKYVIDSSNGEGAEEESK